MKYTKGTQTLLGEIVDVDGEDSDLTYGVRFDRGGSSRCWFTESEIDKIVVKPKLNIDRIEELWFGGEKCEASTFWNELLTKRMSMIKALFEPYIEPHKYPVLTPDELKAVKWLVDGGFTKIERDITGTARVISEKWCVSVDSFLCASILDSSAWITETPIDLKELLEAQEEV